jgi:Protein of unknown function (DUF2568)
VSAGAGEGVRDAAGQNPVDTAAGAATRFAVEVAAWVLVPWAVWRAAGWIAAILVLLAIVAATGTFNAAGDKRHEGVTVPGPVRLALEAALGIGATVAAAYLWGPVGAVLLAVLVVAAAIAGRRRGVWLVHGGVADA